MFHKNDYDVYFHDERRYDGNNNINLTKTLIFCPPSKKVRNLRSPRR